MKQSNRWFGFCVVFLMIISPLAALAQPVGEQLALSLRNNVVSIVAEHPGGSAQNGFGFVVGERSGQVFIAAARHVVVSDEPGSVTPRVQLKFFHEQGVTVEGKLLETSDKTYALAVIRAKAPDGLRWQRQVLGVLARMQRGTQVWFIGRSRDWYVPTESG